MKKLLLKILTVLNYCLIKNELKNLEIMDGKGNFFKPFDLTEHTIDLEVVALSLSRSKRFFGQTELSVAQHSVMLCDYFYKKGEITLAKEALLHDASEAFVGDLVTPVKRLLPIYKRIEQDITTKIFNCYGLNPLISDEVHKADKKIVINEALHHMKHGDYWLSLNEPIDIEAEKFIAWSEEWAFIAFMEYATLLKLFDNKDNKYGVSSQSLKKAQ